MFVQDTLTNLVTGMGTDKDKLSLGRFMTQCLDRAELAALYDSDWLAGKIIDAPPDDMCREWRVWSGGPAQVKALQVAEKTLHVRQRVNRAMKMARLSGGSILLIGTGDADPGKPLDATSIKKGGIKYIHALSRWDVSTGLIDRDMMSPNFGHPSYYELNGANSLRVQIHPSRVIRFNGQRCLDETSSIDGWGYPLLQRVYTAVRDAAAVIANLASMTQEAKVDIISVPSLSQNALNPQYRSQMLARFGLANILKSTNNAVLLDAAETWQQKQISFANHPDVMRAFLEVAAGAADIPATRLLSTSPKGMNSTGESDIRNYYDACSSKQEVELRPTLEPLDIMLMRHAGVAVGAANYAWLPLWQMTEAEQAAIALQKAQADEIIATLGAMPPSAMRSAIRSRLLADNIYPGLAAAIALAIEAKEADAPLILPTQKVEKPGATAHVVKP